MAANSCHVAEDVVEKYIMYSNLLEEIQIIGK